MTALANAITGAAKTLQCLAGYRGDYSRYSGGSAQPKALIVTRDYEVVDDDGIVTLVKSHDWIFRAEDIQYLLPPQPGDRWKVDYNVGFSQSQAADFALPCVAMEIGNKPCFDYHDADGVMIVVHMKRVPNA